MKKTNYFVHESSYIGSTVSIGSGTKIWHFSHIQNDAQIGNDCTFGQNVFVASNVKIGNNVKIQNNVSIYDGVELEDYVFCGPSIVFTNVLKPRSEFPQNDSKKYVKTHIRKSASLGANATIICGVNIGKYAFVGAGSVVARDVPNYGLVIGNPARQIGWVDEKGDALDFSNGNISKCKKFKLIDENVVKVENS